MPLLNTEDTPQGIIFRGVTETAGAVGVDPAHVSRIFHRKAKPSLVLAVKLAKYFGITLEQLCVDLGIGSTGDLQ